MRAGAGMSLWMSYSARAVAGAPLSGMNRADSLRLLRSTCVSMRRLDGDAPTTVSDSKWPNSWRESTFFGRSVIGTRIGMRGPLALLPFERVRCRLPRGRYCLRSNALCGFAWIHWWRHSWLIAHMRVGRAIRPSACPSILSGVHPFLSASMTHASSGEYAMRIGLRDLAGALLGLPLRGHGRVERTATSTRPSSTVSACRGGRTRSRRTRTTGRVSARG